LSFFLRWTLEGHLPYLARSVTLPPHIETRLRGLALKPRSIPSPRHIEFRAGVIAERLGLELPPINAHLVAARLLKDLGLPGVNTPLLVFEGCGFLRALFLAELAPLGHLLVVKRWTVYLVAWCGLLFSSRHERGFLK
jgi:hypothetical protein